MPLAAGLVVLPACKSVRREDAGAVRDLSGEWNDTDAQLVAKALIASCLNASWHTDFAAKHNGRKPVVKVGRIVTRTNGDVINTEIFTNRIANELVRAQVAEVVSASTDAEQIRAERAEQEKHASEGSRKKSFQESGSDLLLPGSINVQDDQDGGDKVKFYQTDLRLTDVTTQRQVWADLHVVKKYVSR